MLALHLAQRVAQELDRDVDGDVALRLEQRKQARRLGAVAGAEVDQRHAGADRARHLGAMRGEDRRFGARRVVLGQLGDRLEQVRAEAVVEELRARCSAGRRSSAARAAARSAPASASQVWMKRGDLVIRAWSASCPVAGASGRRAAHLTAVSPRMQAMQQSTRLASSVITRRARARQCGAAAHRLLLSLAARRAAHVVRAWPAARPVPPLDLADLDGKPWNLDALAGQVVVLNFWATWCEPCRLEMPSLDAMAARRTPDGSSSAPSTTRRRAETIRRLPRAHAVQGDDPARRRRRRDATDGRRGSFRAPS